MSAAPTDQIWGCRCGMPPRTLRPLSERWGELATRPPWGVSRINVYAWFRSAS